MSSNTTDYDVNWRFQMDYTISLYNVKILTGNDLAVTNNKGIDTTLQRIIIIINDDDNNSQIYTICEDCP